MALATAESWQDGAIGQGADTGATAGLFAGTGAYHRLAGGGHHRIGRGGNRAFAGRGSNMLGSGPSWSAVPVEGHLDSARQRGDSPWSGGVVRRLAAGPGTVAPMGGRQGSSIMTNGATSMAAPGIDPVARFTAAARGASEASLARGLSTTVTSGGGRASATAGATTHPQATPTQATAGPGGQRGGLATPAPGNQRSSATPIRRLAWGDGETRPKMPNAWRFAPPPGAAPTRPGDQAAAPTIGGHRTAPTTKNERPAGPATPAVARTNSGTGHPGSPIVRRWFDPRSATPTGEAMAPESQSNFAESLRQELSDRVRSGSIANVAAPEARSGSAATQVVDQFLQLVDARLDAVLESRVRTVVDDRILAETERWAWRNDRGVY